MPSTDRHHPLDLQLRLRRRSTSWPTGETLELTYTIRATDSDASHATDDQTVVVTITGTNDAPVIVADTSGTAGTNVHDLTEGDAALTTSGTLAVSDADVTNTVAASVHRAQRRRHRQHQHHPSRRPDRRGAEGDAERRSSAT